MDPELLARLRALGITQPEGLGPAPQASFSPDQRNPVQRFIQGATADVSDQPILRLAQLLGASASDPFLAAGGGPVSRIRLPKAFGGGIQETLADGTQRLATTSRARGLRSRFVEPGVWEVDTAQGAWAVRRGNDGMWRIRKPGGRSPFEALELDPTAETFGSKNEALAHVRSLITG